MVGKRFTWTNQQPNPILARLDRAFTNLNHNMSFPSGTLSALPYHAQPLIRPTPYPLDNANLFRFERACLLRDSSFLPSVLPAWTHAFPCADAAGMLAACIIKSTRSAAKVWSRRFRAPPYIIPNCKFLIQLVDTFEEVRGLSPAEMQVRTDFRDRLPEALKEINTHLLEAEFGQFGKEMPTLLYFHHAHASMRPRRNGLGPVRWRSME